jgi:hypothetical protein
MCSEKNEKEEEKKKQKERRWEIDGQVSGE